MPQTAKNVLQLVANGNYNHKTKDELKRRAKNEEKLRVSAEHMDPPNYLDPGAKKMFKSIVKLFAKTDLLNEADIPEIARYCDLTMEYKSCNTRLKRNGRSINGKPNPDLRMKLQISAELDKLAKNLGLNPAARASLAINMTDDQKSDDDDEF
ncbi:MAG: phage terminase small subunit P27 family [Ruminococcus flavefaciens]|nr:phage terminase small subunit P27 family [Ruminococcus flavefaciens]